MRTLHRLGHSFLLLSLSTPLIAGAPQLTQTSEQDSLALVALYDSTNGASWYSDTNWLTGEVTTWTGVTVTDGRVTALSLTTNNLTGTIPPEIGNLTALTSLSMNNNVLTDTIPAGIGSLTALTYLDLRYNQLSGSIPTGIGSLAALETLTLYSNQLSGSIPTEIGNLANLTSLTLSSNQLTGSIPTEIGNLTNLTSLYLNNNQLSDSIPTALSGLTSLLYLHINNNLLTGPIPAAIGSLASLTDLRLYSNQLTDSIPSEIGNLSSLTKLWLYDNQLSGSIPSAMGSLSSLTDLQLDRNQLTGSIPAAIGSLTSLTDLRLTTNQLSGSIPAEIGNLTSLDKLFLGDNLLTGAIPVEIGSLTSLRYLYLNTNQLDSIPSAISNLTSLIVLKLEDNLFTGAIPTYFDSLTALSNLYLSSNQFTGAVPTAITTLPALSRLYIDDNQLTDFPDMSASTSIGYLEIQNNEFTFEDIEPTVGTPNPTFTYSPQDSIGTAYDTTLYVGETLVLTLAVGGGSNNRYAWYQDGVAQTLYGLDDTLDFGAVDVDDSGVWQLKVTNTVAIDLTLEARPITITVEYSAEQLALMEQDSLALVAIYDSLGGAGWSTSTNWLTPDSAVSTWYGITFANSRVTGLEMVVNNISGDMPAALGDLTGLQTLDLEANDITSLPAEIENLTALTTLNLGSNSLIGAFPAEVCSLTNLVELNMAYNDLSGSIPASIGNLTSLQILHLYNNQLSGAIPAAIGNLTSLTDLTLTNNLLTAIPAEIGLLTSLTRLYLNYNQLSGAIPAEIGNLTSLESLILYSNQLSGSIPTQIGGLTSLRYLDLTSNQLTGSIPVEIGDLSNLESLILKYNQLSGSIPTQIGNLTNLSYLTLYENQLTGSIPIEIGNLTNLTSLTLYTNLLTGSIPTEIGNLTSLTGLHLFGNQLTGAVPSQITNLTSLTYLNLHDNLLTDLPNLSAMTALLVLYVQNNQLTFEDIIPNIGGPNSTFTYSPQDSVGSAVDTTVYAGDNFTLIMPVGGGANNRWWWKRDAVSISGLLTVDSLELGAVEIADSGRYTVRITNSSASSLSLYSRPIHVTIIDTTAPAAPQSLVAASGHENVSLIWRASDDGDFLRYLIYGGTSPNPTTVIDTIHSLLDTSVTIANLASGTTYYYRVKAVDGSLNESDYSNEADATTNGHPVAVNDITDVSEDGEVVIEVLTNDTDVDGDTLSISSVTQGASGTVSINPGDTTATYTPILNFAGQDTFTYVISDGIGGLDNGQVFVTVNPINDAPVLSGIPATGFAEDDTTLFDLDQYLADVDNDSTGITFTATSSSEDLSVSIDGVSHEVTLSASPDSFGVYTVIFTATDDSSAADTDTILVTVTAVNDAPAITSTAPTAAVEDELYSYTVTVIDVDDANNGSDLLFSLTSEPVGMAVSNTGLVTWTPLNGVLTSGAVTITVADGGEDAAAPATEVFTVAVAPTNDSPVLTGIPDVVFAEDDSTSLDLDVYVSDVDNDPAEITFTAAVIGAAAAAAPPPIQTTSNGGGEYKINVGAGDLVITIDAATHVAKMISTSDTAGTFTVVFTATDDSSAADTDTITITVTPENDAPVITTPIPDQAILEDSGPTLVADLGTVFRDVEEGALTYTSTAPAEIAVTVANDSLWITPAEHYFGADTVIITAMDPLAAATSDTFTVSVSSVNDAPVLTAIPDLEFVEDDSATIDLDLYTTDVDHDSTGISYSAAVIGADASAPPPIQTTSRGRGEFKIDVGAGDLVITIDAVLHVATMVSTSDTSGTFTVVFTATDDSSAADTDTITVTVAPLNDAPLITAPIPDLTIPEDSDPILVAELGAVFRDVEEGAMTYTSSAPADIAVTIANDSLTISIAADYFGLSEVIITATDPLAAATSDTFLVTVSSVNDAPVLSGIPNLEFNEDDSISIDLDAFVTDVDHDTTEITFTASVTDASAAAAKLPVYVTTNAGGDYKIDVGAGDLVITINAANHVATLVSSADSSGLFTVVFTATDDSSAFATETISVTVLAANDSPVLVSNNPLTMDEGGTAVLTSAFLHYSDVDNSPDELVYLWNTHGYPLPGIWYLNEEPFSDSTTFTQADIDNGLVTFDHDGSEGALDSVMFDLTDGANYHFNLLLHIHIAPVNDAPQLVGLPDIVIPEDSTSSYLNLNDYLFDPDNDTNQVWYNYEVLGDDAWWLTINALNSSTFYFRGETNQNGIFTVVFTVTDGYDATGTDTMIVTVTPVNDPPGTFDIWTPGDNHSFTIDAGNINAILYVQWGRSFDVDGDTLQYGFRVTGSLADAIPDTLFDSTSVEVPYRLIAQTMLDNGVSGNAFGTWTVFVTDGMDTVLSATNPLLMSITLGELAINALLGLPTEFALHQNYPNPFNPTTTVRFDLPVSGNVGLTIYDLMGREVLELASGNRQPGYYAVIWDGKNGHGAGVPSGIYIARLVTPEYSKSIKMVLLK